MKTWRTLLLLLYVALAPVARIAAEAVTPLKVFILAGQSNMEGQAVADLDGKNYNGGKGTLKHLLHDPSKAALVKHLCNDRGEWTVRQDVWVRYQPEKGPLKAGPLTLGFTPYTGKHHFGPELQFGHVIGDHFRSQVLLIKTAWGGKSLFKDFRPPTSGGDVGSYYQKMIAQVRQALADLKKDFPAYDSRGYELAGFVWYQGWNDGVDPKNAVPEYEQNLVNLIKDVRKDLNAPQLPVVIGELTSPWVQAPGAWAKLRRAQAAAAERPEFKGNVLFVETHNFVRKPEDSPNPGHGHHEFGNAETYILVGNALGHGMVKLLTQAPVLGVGKATETQGNQEHARVLIATKKGNIELELYPAKAPVTVASFLRYVDGRFYDGGQFHRTVTPSNQPDNKVKIEVIQAAIDATKKALFPPIKLERTRDTGLKHTDRTISMARDGPDTAISDFFICIGDQPELDFGGKRNPDGQGFAAFGRVVRGMDVVRTIQAAPAEGQALSPPVKILKSVRIP